MRGSSAPFSTLRRQGLNPIKPVYDPDRPDGRLNLTASAFNQLGQYTSSPDRSGYCYAELAVFYPIAVVVTIASTQCAYPRRDGQAELAWVVGYVVRQFTCPKAVTHPSTNRCASGCVVECRICNREVAGSNLSLRYFAPGSTQPSIPPGSVNEYQLRLEGKGRYGSFRLRMNVWVCR